MNQQCCLSSSLYIGTGLLNEQASTIGALMRKKSKKITLDFSTKCLSLSIIRKQMIVILSRFF